MLVDINHYASADFISLFSIFYFTVTVQAVQLSYRETFSNCFLDVCCSSVLIVWGGAGGGSTVIIKCKRGDFCDFSYSLSLHIASY